MGFTFRRKIIVSDDTVTSARHLTVRQSMLPNMLVMILFFLWGFTYGLVDVLNSHFQEALKISSARAAGLSSAYFGAYLICPPTFAGWLLRRFGYRLTFMTGLAILAVGCVLFWPSGVNKSFGGFCGSMFIVGAAISTLETAANPFIACCGPPKWSEVRVNFAQGIQGVGSFIAPLLASRVFFSHKLSADEEIENVQWVYMGVAGFVSLLILLFYLAPFPEITDADMGLQEGEIGGPDPGPFRKQYNLFLAIWSQFCFVGAQVAVANYFIYFCREAGRTSEQSSDLLAVGQGLYAFNRFAASGLMLIPMFKPRYILAIYLCMCIVFSIAAMNTTGTASIAMLMLVQCFESAGFATIFTLGLRGLGRHTKLGGSLIVAGISGGMVFPPMMGAVNDRLNAHKAMIIPMVGFLLAYVYPVYVNIWNKESLDAHRETTIGIEPVRDKQLEMEAQQDAVHEEHRGTGKE